MTTQPVGKAFISHSHEDKARARELDLALRKNGVDTWFDAWEILPGDSLVQKIFEEGLRSCSAFLVLLSPASVGSRWVREELDVALIRRIEGAVRVIPVVLEPCEIPIALRSLLWLDASTGIDAVARRIANVIHGRSDVPLVGPAPTQLSFDVPGLSRLSAQVAVHLSGALDAPSGTPQAFEGRHLAKALSLQPQEINDAIEELEARGLVQVRRFLGTAPYNFGIAEPTYALALQLRNTPALDYDPEEDIKIVANAVVNREGVDGPDLLKLTNLSPGRINAAIQYLDDYGLVSVLRAQGTGPFDFAAVRATGATRRFVVNNS